MSTLLQLAGLIEVQDRDDVARAAPLVQQAGMDWVQLDLCTPDWTADDLSRWADILQEHFLECGAVGCYVNLLRPEDAAATGASVRELRRAVENHPVLGARKFIVWSGTFAEDPHAGHPDNHTMPGQQALTDAILDLLPLFEDHDVQMVIEPFHHHVVSSPEACLALIAGVPNNRITFVCDPVNLLTPDRAGEADTFVAETLEELRGHASVIHLKDWEIEGDAVVYREPGSGRLDSTSHLAAISGLGAPLLTVFEQTPPERLQVVADWVRRRLPE